MRIMNSEAIALIYGDDPENFYNENLPLKIFTHRIVNMSTLLKGVRVEGKIMTSTEKTTGKRRPKCVSKTK